MSFEWVGEFGEVAETGMNIKTDYNSLCHRWNAWDDNDEGLTGTGDTEQEAIDNLLEKDNG